MVVVCPDAAVLINSLLSFSMLAKENKIRKEYEEERREGTGDRGEGRSEEGKGVRTNLQICWEQVTWRRQQSCKLDNSVWITTMQICNPFS